MSKEDNEFHERHYETDAGETVEIARDQYGRYTVACWDSEGDNRWFLYFDKRSDAEQEFERWR
jgi:hypothetical protein